MAERFEGLGHPFTFGRGLQRDAGGWALTEQRGELRAAHAHPAFGLLGVAGAHDTDLADALMDVDADALHGWPPFGW
jgi:hypothetical protein